jgi:hypothetical protein
MHLVRVYSLIKSGKYQNAIDYAKSKKFNGKYNLFINMKIGEALYFLKKFKEAKIYLEESLKEIYLSKYFNDNQLIYLKNYCKYFIFSINGNIDVRFREEIDTKKLGGVIHSIFWHRNNYN